MTCCDFHERHPFGQRSCRVSFGQSIIILPEHIRHEATFSSKKISTYLQTWEAHSGLAQKLAINKTSTIFAQSS